MDSRVNSSSSTIKEKQLTSFQTRWKILIFLKQQKWNYSIKDARRFIDDNCQDGLTTELASLMLYVINWDASFVFNSANASLYIEPLLQILWSEYCSEKDREGFLGNLRKSKFRRQIISTYSGKYPWIVWRSIQNIQNHVKDKVTPIWKLVPSIVSEAREYGISVELLLTARQNAKNPQLKWSGGWKAKKHVRRIGHNELWKS